MYSDKMVVVECKCVEVATAYFRHYSYNCLKEVCPCDTSRIMATFRMDSTYPNWMPMKQHPRGSKEPSLQSTCSSLTDVADSATGGAIGSPDHSNAVLFSHSVRKPL
jgi:hypothetical protein